MSRSPVVRTITTAERRARLAVRHRLAPSARTDDDVAAIARSVVALHATDPITVVLSTMVRMQHPDLARIERALYDDRSVLRMLAMRRTLFGVAIEDVAVMQAAASDAVAAVQRKRLAAEVEAAGVARDGARWLADVGAKAVAAVEELGEATAAQLGAAVPELGTRLTIAPGKRYEATVSVSSRMLVILGAEGHLVRGRPNGRWFGSQHRWTTQRAWLGNDLEPVPVEEARAALVRAWLERFGPGTVQDLKWWSGWSLGATRSALAQIEIEEVDLNGQAGLVVAGDTDPTPVPEPWVALLPSLDPTVMGWSERDWYLGEHRTALFDTVGNAGPTIWVDGRAVGAWGQRKSGEIVTDLLEDIGRERTTEVKTEAERVQAMLGDVVVSFRFTSALGRRLVD